MIKVSIIVPVYNNVKTLNRCIDSIINQSLKEIEVILVDDGSTDSSGAICDQYKLKDERIVVIHKSNGGPNSARNAGLKIVKGQYIGFVDSDDYISLNMYEKLYNSAEENNTEVVICDMVEFNDEKKLNRIECSLSSNELIGQDEILDLMSSINESRILWFAQRYLYKASFIKNNNFVFAESLKIGEETVLNLLVLMNCNSIFYLKEELYYYYSNPNGITRGKFRANALKELENLYEAKKKFS